MTDLVTMTETDPGGLVAWARAAGAAHDLAVTLVKTAICPEPFRNKAGEATAVILLGAELGLTPIAALRSMYVIRGQVGMYANAVVALTLSRGHRIWTETETDARVVVAGHRAGDQDHVERADWTIERARLAGFIRRGPSGTPSQYETQPRTMLWARAASQVCRRIAADALAGVPELGDEPEETSAPTATTTRTTVPRYRAALPMPEPLQEAEAEEVVGSAAARVDSAGIPPATPPDAEPPPPATTTVSEAGGTGEPAMLDVELPEPTITDDQRTRLMVEFNARGLRDHDARVAWLSRFIGREITSSRDLLVTEASSAIDRLVWERESADDDHR